jgi:hypothetical protein
MDGISTFIDGNAVKLAQAEIGDQAPHRMLVQFISSGGVHEHYVTEVEIVSDGIRQTWTRELGDSTWTRSK